MSKIFTTEGVLPQQIAEWKEKLKLKGGVYACTVPVSEEENAEVLTGYFRKPTIDEMGMVSESNNKAKAVKAIYKECLLGGHPSFQLDVEEVSDEEIVKAAFKYFQQLVKTRQGEIKKL